MEYHVQITPLMKAVCQTLIEECEGVDYCIVQQQKNIIVEVSRSDIEQTVLVLKKHFPDVVDIRKAYLMIEDLHDFILVKPFTSESPVFQEEGIPVPTIEKMMVDRISDKEYGKRSLEDSVQMYQRIMETYSVNTSRLLRYAARKGKKELTPSRPSVRFFQLLLCFAPGCLAPSPAWKSGLTAISIY